MKKKEKIILISLVVLFAVFIGQLYIYISNKQKKKNVVEEYSINNVNLSEISVTKNEMEKYIKDKYFEKDDIAIFSSYLGKGTEFSLAELTGALRLISQLNLTELQRDEFKDIFYNYLDTNPNISKLHLLYFESFLYKAGIKTKIDASEAKNIVLKYYNKGNMLFGEEQDEPINIMLDDTNMVIEICENYGLKLNVLDQIKIKVLDMYNSPKYFLFDYNDLIKQQIPVAICAILNKFNLNDNEKEISEFHKTWLSNQEGSLKKYYVKDSLSLSYLDYLLEANKFFNQIPKSTIDFVTECSKLNQEEVEKIDLDGTYRLLSLGSKTNVNMEELKKIIVSKFDKELKNEFKIENNIPINIDEIYYGTLLAEKFNIQYNKSKIEKTVKKFIQDNINENFKYETYFDVRNIFYTILISKHMGIDFTVPNNLIEKMNMFISRKIENINEGNNGGENFSYGNLYEVYLTIQSINLLDKKVDRNTINIIKQLLNNKTLSELDNGFSNTVIAFYEISKLYNYKDNTDTEVYQYLNKYYSSGQFYKRKKESTSEDLQSTFNVLIRFNKNTNMLNKNTNMLNKNTIKRFRDVKQIYKVSKDSDYSRLEIVFYGIKLEALIK